MIYSSTSGKILIGKEALNGVGKMGVKVMKGELTSEWGGDSCHFSIPANGYGGIKMAA